MYEEIHQIAIEVCGNNSKMTFNELADRLGQDHRMMGLRVGRAWCYFKDRNDCGACSVISAAFVDANGKSAISNKWN